MDAARLVIVLWILTSLIAARGLVLRGGVQNGLPRHSIQPYVLGVTSYNGDGIIPLGSPVYIFVSFNEPVKVDTTGGSPTLQMATGNNFEPTANHATATFLAGGVTTSRAFWKVDRAENKTEAALPCKAGAVSDPTKAGPAYCLSTVPEVRDDGLMDNVLAFTFTVSAGQLSGQLDYTGSTALSLNGASISSAANPTVFALLQLPPPGNDNTGKVGSVQSLSYNKNLQVGAVYVTNVTSANFDGTYGLKPGGNPDTLDILVSFSNPVTVTCAWQSSTCYQIQLALDTGPVTINTTTGTSGWEVFPTAYLVQSPAAPHNVLTFRYVVRRGDVTANLNAFSNGLLVANPASIQRTVDGTAASVVLPLATSKYSLKQLKSITVGATF